MKPSAKLSDLAAKGIMTLRPRYNCRTKDWSIYYFTRQGGWARLDSYCLTAYALKEDAEQDIDRLIKLHPNKFLKEQDDNTIQPYPAGTLFQ